MKKLTSIAVIIIMLSTFFIPAYADSHLMYAPDGRVITVPSNEIEAYKNVGWFENKSDVTKTMYAPDGRTIVIYKSEINAYKKVGWFENKSDVTKTMYAPDGRTIVIYKSEINAYKKVGWFENKSDVTKTMYAPDGRTIVIYKSEINAYKKVGWFENKSDVTSVMCAPDGRKINVLNKEVQAYINVGWAPAQKNKIDPSKPMVAITYDDGPRSKSTGKILDTLELYNVRATFFVVGNIAVNNKALLNRMNSLNCQIGNHTYSHPNLTTLSNKEISYQLSETDKIINDAVGYHPSVIRPPYGSYNSTVLTIADKPLILWSIDTLDWKYRNSAYVTNAVLSNVRNGDIILMHDLYDSTAEASEKIIPVLLSRGFQLVTVDELACYKSTKMQPHKSYGRFR